ncbi:MAG TPA: hypothetical protein VG965_02295 [Patescibacteria group bacterium]|nr:hypothetical protein [Patescibacteria group bacterium]
MTQEHGQFDLSELKPDHFATERKEISEIVIVRSGTNAARLSNKGFEFWKLISQVTPPTQDELILALSGKINPDTRKTLKTTAQRATAELAKIGVSVVPIGTTYAICHAGEEDSILEKFNAANKTPDNRTIADRTWDRAKPGSGKTPQTYGDKQHTYLPQAPKPHNSTRF